MHSSGDTNCGLSCFRWYVSLVLNVYSSGDSVVCLVPEGELTCFLMCTVLVTQVVACPVSEGKLV